jgi:hypothetical protein
VDVINLVQSANESNEAESTRLTATMDVESTQLTGTVGVEGSIQPTNESNTPESASLTAAVDNIHFIPSTNESNDAESTRLIAAVDVDLSGEPTSGSQESFLLLQPVGRQGDQVGEPETINPCNTTTAAEIMYEYLIQPANESNTERFTHVNDSDVEESADPGILQHNSADEPDVPVNEDNQLLQLQLQLQPGELVVELNEEEELAFINEIELTVASSTSTETRLELTQQNLYEVHSQTMNNPDCQNVIVEFNGQNYELLLHTPTSARVQHEDAVSVTDANNLYTEGEQHQEEGPVHQQ